MRKRTSLGKKTCSGQGGSVLIFKICPVSKFFDLNLFFFVPFDFMNTPVTR